MSENAIRYINLDCAASTPMRQEAIEAQREYDNSELAGINPNSLHTLGRKAADRLERCRRAIARTFGENVRPSEVIFTAGGTEANQLALLGISEGARQREKKRTRVLVSAIEHDSILDNLPLLRQAGFTVELVNPTPQGFIDPDELDKHLADDVALVSVMFANNETGVIQPIKELAAHAHAYGARFHTDAIQGYLHAPLDVKDLDVDALSVAGHKIGGPVATGALYIKFRTPLRPRVYGGGQEAGRRAGTQDLRSQLAFTAAAKAAYGVLSNDSDPGARADAMYRKLLSCPRIHATVGNPFSVKRLPGIVSIYVDGFDSEELILQLDARGFEVSAGSACSSGSNDPSHVLTAMKLDRDSALSSLRISFDDRIADIDLERFCQVLLDIAGGSAC